MILIRHAEHFDELFKLNKKSYIGMEGRLLFFEDEPSKVCESHLSYIRRNEKPIYLCQLTIFPCLFQPKAQRKISIYRAYNNIKVL